MKKILSVLSLVALMGLAATPVSYAEETVVETVTVEETVTTDAAPAAEAPAAAEAAPAEAAAEAPKTMDVGSTAFMIVATVLVILMTIPGLALFYGGLVRQKNMLSVLMQVFVVFSLVSVIWAAYGYSAAFSEGNMVVGGLSKAFLAGITPDSLTGVIPEYVFLTFQLTFAAITPALIVGGFAERMKFSAVLLFTALWVTFAYLSLIHISQGIVR